jgi:hypothetical protein
VISYPFSSTRRRNFDGWQRLRQALVLLVPVTSQWVDGSFVTAKPDPADLDLTTLFDGPAFDNLPDIKRKAVNGLLAGRACQAIWHCDSFPIAVYPQGHQHRARYEAFFGIGSAGGDVPVADSLKVSLRCIR